MLEIQENLSAEGYEELRSAAKGAQLHITEALDGESTLGFIAYSYGSECTTVYDYDDGGDLMLCDGLVRSVMFKSVLKGIKHMLFQLPDDSKFANLKKLRFLSGDSRLCEDLDSFMNACGHCRSSKDAPAE